MHSELHNQFGHHITDGRKLKFLSKSSTTVVLEGQEAKCSRRRSRSTGA